MEAGLAAALAARRRVVEAAMGPLFDDVRPPRLKEATRWYPDAGGKRLRPIMALLACEAAGGRPDDAVPMALAVELVHNFSLVHDDIMDRDATRRGRPTVHTRWDEPTAILAGDVLFAKAFEALATIPDPAAHRASAALLASTVRRLCEGQARDMDFERTPPTSVEDYLAMIEGKTALLFEAACRGGALAAPGGESHVGALARFGEAFGMAFQVADDLLDVTADSATMGKPWGSDVRAGKRTVLVLEALARADASQQKLLLDVLGRQGATDEEVRGAVDVLAASGAIQAAADLRDAYAAKAATALAPLPDSVAKTALLALNAWAVGRTH